MTIEYQFDENDLLTYQLYAASKSERIKKIRLRTKLSVLLIFLGGALISFFKDMLPLSIVYVVLGVLWLFICPLWERKRYANHYKLFIKEKYKGIAATNVIMSINNDIILAKDSGSESKLSTTEITEIDEIPNAIFMRIKGGQAFVIPKNQISNLEELKTTLSNLANHLNISYNIENDWKWK